MDTPLLEYEDARELARAIWKAYSELGAKAGLSRTSLAALAGLSLTRAGQLNHPDSASAPALHTYLRLQQLVPRLQQGLEDGWLPATADRGVAQRVAVARLQGK